MRFSTKIMLKSFLHRRALVPAFLALALLGTMELMAEDGGTVKSPLLRRLALPIFPYMENMTAKDVFANNTSTSRMDTPVPRILHYMVLGESPPEYMLEMARVNMERISSSSEGFTAKLWRDEDVERLITEHGDEKLIEAWEYAKATDSQKRYAKMADFMRPLIMYKEGGVYLDADVVPCGGLEFMVDIPGVVSFPQQHSGSNQVNGAMMSSPPGHRLMEMTLEYFKSLGSKMTSLHNLEAAGPCAIGVVMDFYFAESSGRDDLLKISESRSLYEHGPNIVTHGEFWSQIADIRFAQDTIQKSMFHVEFRSWVSHHVVPTNGCAADTSRIKPWIEAGCTGTAGATLRSFSDCTTFAQQSQA